MFFSTDTAAVFLHQIVLVRLGIILLELDKNTHNIWHWEWFQISAPDFNDWEPCLQTMHAIIENACFAIVTFDSKNCGKLLTL